MIVTQGLGKTFRNKRGAVEAVRGVDLRVREGEIFGFLGPNGAGKTTTMRMLTTLMVPTRGTATVVGRDLFREARLIRQDIGYVSQKGGALEMATGFENLVLQGRLYGLTKAEACAKAEAVVARFGMGEYCARNVQTLSGGQRRHVDLGMGVMHDPRLLFLDEPTTGLDPHSRARFWDVIRGLREHGITVFLTTHYLDEADRLCDTICIMDRGSVVATGSADELKREVAGDVVTVGVPAADAARARDLLAGVPGVSGAEVVGAGAGGEGSGSTGAGVKLYVEAGERSLAPLLARLAEAGIAIARVEMVRPTLDEVFLRATGRGMDEAQNEGGGGEGGEGGGDGAGAGGWR